MIYNYNLKVITIKYNIELQSKINIIILILTYPLVIITIKSNINLLPEK